MLDSLNSLALTVGWLVIIAFVVWVIGQFRAATQVQAPTTRDTVFDDFRVRRTLELRDLYMKFEEGPERQAIRDFAVVEPTADSRAAAEYFYAQSNAN
jgi:hypothetical protein